MNWPKIKQTRLRLVELFPLTFMAKGAVKKPLKVGIDQDILAATSEFTRDELEEALIDYTTGKKYLETMVEGAERIGLDGQPVEIVTASHAGYARYLRNEQERKWSQQKKKRLKRDLALGLVATSQQSHEATIERA